MLNKGPKKQLRNGINQNISIRTNAFTITHRSVSIEKIHLTDAFIVIIACNINREGIYAYVHINA